MNLLEKTLSEERLAVGKSLLNFYDRNDLKIVAVNKMYGNSYVCEEQNGTLNYYLISETTFRNDYRVHNDMGPNYILIDDKHLAYESVRLNKGKYYTCCSRGALKYYLQDGWEVENN